MPADSEAWDLNFANPGTLMPSTGYFVDVLPAMVVFGLGISMLVAPLTTALMSSVPTGNSGLASAINNAISRIGPLLATAVIFIGVSAAFYGGLTDRLPDTDVSSAQVRDELPPLNEPAGEASAKEKRAARESSTDAFRLAMLISALLCASGAVVNWVGIRDPQPGDAAQDSG